MTSPITGATRVLALIADPVAQARSPAMANERIAARGQAGRFVLVPLQVPRDGLEPFVAALRKIESFAGAVVSMPHKIAMSHLVDELAPEARLVGAVNVIRRNADGTLAGTILDGEGFVAGLAAAGHSVAGKSCLLAGAGGAASAIAFALVKHGCASLQIVNRTQSKADALAAQIHDVYPSVPNAPNVPNAIVRANGELASHYDLAINATSLGMKEDDVLPFSEESVARCDLVAECVLAPEITQLLEVARSRGRRIHTGVPMLAAQMELLLDFMGVPRG